MNTLFNEPLFYIFFVYGLSFLIMAYVVFHGVKNATAMALVSSYYALALFGLTHGLTELIDWVRFIVKVTDKREIELLKYLSQGLLITSFVVLLQFGINLLTYANAKRRAFRFIPAVVFGAYLAGLLVTKTSDVLEAGLIARRSFGIAGSLLSGIGLFVLANSMKAVLESKVVKGLLVTGFGFCGYAVFGGLLIQPIAGLPIQLFRAGCAVAIAVSSFYFLGIFRAAEADLNAADLQVCEAELVAER